MFPQSAVPNVPSFFFRFTPSTSIFAFCFVVLIFFATVETNAIRKEAGFDGKFTYGMENIATNKRNLMNPDELLKLDNNKEIVIVRGRKPFICNKYDYSKHIEASKMEDMTIEEQREKFKDNVENEKNKQQPKKVKYSFKDF